jgi:hypothetical protein
METKLEYEADIVLPIIISPRTKNVVCKKDGTKYADTETGYYCPHCGSSGWWSFGEHDSYPS